MLGVYQDHGIRFEYPPEWDLDVDDDGPATTVSVHSPDGMAFALVRLDENGPDPADVADEALAAMREEYPELDAAPALETIDGHKATGHDVEFFSLDMTNTCAIRCYRTESRTVLVFSQWSELDDPAIEATMKALRVSLEEVDD